MKHKTIILIVLFMLFIPYNAGAQSAPSVIDTTMPISGEIRNAIDAWLAVSAPVPLPYWAITYAGKKDEETGKTFVSVVALNLVSPTDKWYIYDDNLVEWMGSVTVNADYSVEVVSDGGYSDPISRSGGKLAAPLLDGGGGNVRFPWEEGASMMYGVRGIHAAGGGAAYAIGFSAVDFLGGDDLGASVASNRVFAVAEGQIDYVCQDSDTTLIRTENEATDDYYIYAHLLENEMLAENYTFYQGDYIGSLKYGSFDNTCGWAEQTAKHYHLHFGFKPANGFFSMSNCTLSMSSQKWNCGSKTIATGQFLSNFNPGGGVITGDDGNAYADQTNFWDLMLNGAAIMWDEFVIKNMPDHTTNSFLYALYNGVSVAVRVARVIVYSNINLSHLMAVVFFGLIIKGIFAVAEFIVFLFKAWKSLVPIIGA